MQFVGFLEKITVGEEVETTVIRRLVKTYYEAGDVPNFIKEVVYNYGPKVDKLMEKELEHLAKEMFCSIDNPNRPLFSEETAHKIMCHLEEKTVEAKG